MGDYNLIWWSYNNVGVFTREFHLSRARPCRISYSVVYFQTTSCRYMAKTVFMSVFKCAEKTHPINLTVELIEKKKMHVKNA